MKLTVLYTANMNGAKRVLKKELNWYSTVQKLPGLQLMQHPCSASVSEENSVYQNTSAKS